MTKFFSGKTLLAAGSVAALIIAGMTAANADGDRDRDHDRIRLSNRPKTIVIDNLDTAKFTKGDPVMAARAQEICGDCHSVDYATTQPKLSCKQWASEIIKMGNTFRANVPWLEDGVTRDDLYGVLDYLNKNYGKNDACPETTSDHIPSGLDALKLPDPIVR